MREIQNCAERGFFTNKVSLLTLSVFFTAAALYAGGNPENERDNVSEVKEKVSFQYLWGGNEAAYIESMIGEFNDLQDSFTVEGQSVPDAREILLVIAAGNSPDLSDTFSSLTASYAAKEIMEPLDPFVQRDNYDLSDFMSAAIKGVTVDGTLYALPVAVNLMMLYYNKDLLASGGITQLPQTDEELISYAISLTRVDSEGHMEIQGFPDFPELYYIEHMTYALGGDFGDPGRLTPDNPAAKRALEMIVKFRKTFGLNTVLTFNSRDSYMSPGDPFISGRQAFRIDGLWLGNHISNVLGIDLNYGVIPIPYRAEDPGSRGSGQVQSSTFYIPASAENKEGGWALMNWLLQSDTMARLSGKMGWIPSRISALDSAELKDVLNFEAFAAMARSENLKTFPVFAAQQEYQKIIFNAFQKAMTLESGIDDALREAEIASSSLY